MGNFTQPAGIQPVYIAGQGVTGHWLVIYVDYRFELMQKETDGSVILSSRKIRSPLRDYQYIKVGLSDCNLFKAFSYANSIVESEQYQFLFNDCQNYATKLAERLLGVSLSRASGSLQLSSSPDSTPDFSVNISLYRQRFRDYDQFDGFLSAQIPPTPVPTITIPVSEVQHPAAPRDELPSPQISHASPQIHAKEAISDPKPLTSGPTLAIGSIGKISGATVTIQNTI